MFFEWEIVICTPTMSVYVDLANLKIYRLSYGVIVLLYVWVHYFCVCTLLVLRKSYYNFTV
jgi:hypothetical protein